MQTLFVKLQILIESWCKYLVKFNQKASKRHILYQLRNNSHRSFGRYSILLPLLFVCTSSADSKRLVSDIKNQDDRRGFPEDPTRLPEYYDGTYEYLKSLGLKEI